MTLLTPMAESAFGAFLSAEIASYAEANVTAGRWAAEGALERSAQEIDRLLPEGMATPMHHFFEIRASAEGAPVGSLWLALQERDGRLKAFVYNIEINADSRRQGHARGALLAAEEFAASQGASTLGLHVFGYNSSARALYESLGFVATSITMEKPLAAAGSGLTS